MSNLKKETVYIIQKVVIEYNSDPASRKTAIKSLKQHPNSSAIGGGFHGWYKTDAPIKVLTKDEMDSRNKIVKRHELEMAAGIIKLIP